MIETSGVTWTLISFDEKIRLDPEFRKFAKSMKKYTVEDPPYYKHGKKAEDYTDDELNEIQRYVITRVLFLWDPEGVKGGMEEDVLFYMSNAVLVGLGLPPMRFDEDKVLPDD